MHVEKDNFPVKRMARLLGFSTSGYYNWTQRQAQEPSPRAANQRARDQKIAKIFEDSYETYGAPRVAAQLARDGISADQKTVADSMRRRGIEGISPRRVRPLTTIPGVGTYHLPYLVHRKWDRGRLEAIWISDITYLRTREGWLYLCAVRDGYSRRVLGWAMDSVQNTDLVERALRMAHMLRGELPADVVFHADRGAQFTSTQLWEASKELGILQSVGRTGVCWDNAMQESFWSTLKTEFFDRRVWETWVEAKARVAWWIEDFYNRRRRHSKIGMVPPTEFEQKIKARKKIISERQDVLMQAA